MLLSRTESWDSELEKLACRGVGIQLNCFFTWNYKYYERVLAERVLSIISI